MDSVPKSRVHDSFSLQGEAFGRNCYLVVFYDCRFVTDIGFSMGRSCHPLALRNQWMTDVGCRRRRHRILPKQNPKATEGRPYCYGKNSLTVQLAARKPTKSAINAAGTAYLVLAMPQEPK